MMMPTWMKLNISNALYAAVTHIVPFLREAEGCDALEHAANSLHDGHGYV